MGALRTAARPVSQYGGNGRKIKVLLDFFQKIAVSKGSAFGRPSQRAKYPRRARREIPNRPNRHPQMAESPANGHGLRRHPCGMDGGGHLLTMVRRAGRCGHRPLHSFTMLPTYPLPPNSGNKNRGAAPGQRLDFPFAITPGRGRSSCRTASRRTCRSYGRHGSFPDRRRRWDQ